MLYIMHQNLSQNVKKKFLNLPYSVVLILYMIFQIYSIKGCEYQVGTHTVQNCYFQ